MKCSWFFCFWISLLPFASYSMEIIYTGGLDNSPPLQEFVFPNGKITRFELNQINNVIVTIEGSSTTFELPSVNPLQTAYYNYKSKKKCFNLRLENFPSQFLPTLFPLRNTIYILDLTGSYLGHEGIKILCKDSSFKNLKSLILARNNIDNTDLVFLINHLESPNLTELNLSSNSLKCYGMLVLSQSPLLKQLFLLDICDNKIGDKGINFLAQSKYSEKLETLLIRSNCISTPFKNLQTPTFMVSLNYLDLGKNSLTDIFLKNFCSYSFFSNLTVLILSHNNFNSAGLEYVFTSAFLQKLQILDIDYDKGTFDTVKFFLNNNYLPYLQELQLVSKTKINPQGIKEIHQMRPYLQINFQN